MSFESLKRPADRKFEAMTLPGQENAGQFLSKSKLTVRIVKVDQAKRNVDDRDLNPHLDTNARLEIAELSKP